MVAGRCARKTRKILRGVNGIDGLLFEFASNAVPAYLVTLVIGGIKVIC
jgi:hypothetical protein